MYKEKLKKIGENQFELPKEEGMLVPGLIFFSDKMVENIEEDSLKQVANVAHLPGILKYSIGLSDMHLGYGFPIGGVAAFDLDKGVISPGGVGFDINCGVRLLRTNLSKEDILKKQKEVLESLDRKIKFIDSLDKEKMESKIYDDRFNDEVSIEWIILRGNIDHEIHHRGQIAVYLRVLKDEK